MHRDRKPVVIFMMMQTRSCESDDQKLQNGELVVAGCDVVLAAAGRGCCRSGGGDHQRRVQNAARRCRNGGSLSAGKATGLCADAPSLCNVRESSVLLPQLRAALYPPRGQKQIWYPPPVRARQHQAQRRASAQLQFPGAKKVMVTHTTSGASYPVTFAPRLLDGRLHGIFGQTFRVISSTRIPAGYCTAHCASAMR